MKEFNRLMYGKYADSENLLIVDLNNIMYKAIHVHQALYCGKLFTGGLYGVVFQIKAAIRKYEIENLIVCNDSPSSYLRSALGIDKGRKNPVFFEQKKINETRQLCIDFFTTLNVKVWQVEGLEADDLIANLCCQWRRRVEDKNIYIMSNDSDLFQLLAPGVCLIRNKQALYTCLDFQAQYPRITPAHWPWITALTGGHNGLPGFEGIGEIRAIGIVQDHKKLNRFIQKHLEVIKYYSLAKLPLIDIVKIPTIKSPTKQSLLETEIFLRRLNFKGDYEAQKL